MYFDLCVLDVSVRVCDTKEMCTSCKNDGSNLKKHMTQVAQGWRNSFMDV